MTNQLFAIDATGLRKAFGDKTVLDGIDISVQTGRVFALLGPNGAGKTTTVNILTTLVPADSGTVHIGGQDLAADPEAVRALIGVTGQFAAIDNLLTGEENLRLMAKLLHLGRQEGRQRVAELLAQFDLADAAKQLPSTYSGGMRRRLDLAMGLVSKPQIIFLDEPTTGLDPRSRRMMWQVIRDLVTDGATMFLTTQYLEEADQLADRIAVLDGGRIVAEGTSDELKRRIPGGHVRVQFPDQRELDSAERLLGDVLRDDAALALQVPNDGSAQSVKALLDQLDHASVEADTVTVHTPDLDDVFLALTGNAQEEKKTP